MCHSRKWERDDEDADDDDIFVGGRLGKRKGCLAPCRRGSFRAIYKHERLVIEPDDFLCSSFCGSCLVALIFHDNSLKSSSFASFSPSTPYLHRIASDRTNIGRMTSLVGYNRIPQSTMTTTMCGGSGGGGGGERSEGDGTGCDIKSALVG